MHCLAILTTAQNLQGRFTLNEYVNYLQVPDWVQQTTTSDWLIPKEQAKFDLF